MKSNLAIVLAAAVGVSGCTKLQEVYSDPADKVPNAGYTMMLSGDNTTDRQKAKVFFYNDPQDPSTRCQTVIGSQGTSGIATSCWKVEPK